MTWLCSVASNVDEPVAESGGGLQSATSRLLLNLDATFHEDRGQHAHHHVDGADPAASLPSSSSSTRLSPTDGKTAVIELLHGVRSEAAREKRTKTRCA